MYRLLYIRENHAFSYGSVPIVTIVVQPFQLEALDCDELRVLLMVAKLCRLVFPNIIQGTCCIFVFRKPNFTSLILLLDPLPRIIAQTVYHACVVRRCVDPLTTKLMRQLLMSSKAPNTRFITR